MVFFSTKMVLSAISNDYWENRHCLTNGMTAQKFIFTLGMERSRVLDKGEIRRLNNGRERKLAQGGKNPGQQLHYPGQ